MPNESLQTQAADPESQLRFEFGANWRRFLRQLNQERVAAAELSLKEMLGCENLHGKKFLDVGSGSGLFSLAARRLGARVLSFDYDSESVACARELKRTFFPQDGEWRIEQGSVLDQDYLRSLGQFEVVYSWGVLHHTGAMWEALGNVETLVKEGGTLFIAIYNDQGIMSDFWLFVKRSYNRLPPSLRFVILWPMGAFFVSAMTLKDIFRLRRPRVFSRSSSPRAMSLWTDIIDWVGGYPFEVAAPAKIVGFYQQRGLRLDRLVDCGRKFGCNQYVFRKS